MGNSASWYSAKSSGSPAGGLYSLIQSQAALLHSAQAAPFHSGTYTARLRLIRPRASRPAPIRARLVGSGTGLGFPLPNVSSE